MGVEQTYYDVLGLSPDCAQSAIVKAYRQLVREHHPDRFQISEEKIRAEEFLKKVTEAYNALSKPHLRSRYDKSLDSSEPAMAPKPIKEQAAELIRQAKNKALLGDRRGALVLYDYVLTMDPDNSEALYSAGMIRLQNPRWRARGAEQVKRAIEKNPFAADFVVGYAKVLLESGQTLRARRLLEAAVPNHPGEDRIKDLLSQLDGGKSSGFSLFGKK